MRLRRTSLSRPLCVVAPTSQAYARAIDEFVARANEGPRESAVGAGDTPMSRASTRVENSVGVDEGLTLERIEAPSAADRRDMNMNAMTNEEHRAQPSIHDEEVAVRDELVTNLFIAQRQTPTGEHESADREPSRGRATTNVRPTLAKQRAAEPHASGASGRESDSEPAAADELEHPGPTRDAQQRSAEVMNAQIGQTHALSSDEDSGMEDGAVMDDDREHVDTIESDSLYEPEDNDDDDGNIVDDDDEDSD